MRCRFATFIVLKYKNHEEKTEVKLRVLCVFHGFLLRKPLLLMLLSGVIIQTPIHFIALILTFSRREKGFKERV